MSRPEYEISHNQFGPNSSIHQGNNTINKHFNIHLPPKPARRAAIRIIPYPLNEDLINRSDIVNKLNALLPHTSQAYSSAALWGLGGSGKTQIALDYAYQRCGNTSCSVFWVHADSEATFSQDYKTVARAFGIDEKLKGEDLFAAVRDQIAALPNWVLILDNADDLRLFGVGKGAEKTSSFFQYVPRAPAGTVLWTSRDAHITGTLVGSSRSIKVSRMEHDEAEMLLKTAGSLETGGEQGDIVALLEELQWLPLAIMQAGAYMRRTSTSAKEYSSLLAQSKQRWDILREDEFDRHRRPEVPNNVLETWSISIDRLRQESKVAYNILHAIAYVANKNIPHEVITAILARSEGNLAEPDKLDSEATKAITRLKEFSFIGIHQVEDGSRSYEMHKLVQEATRYGLSVWKPGDIDEDDATTKGGEQYFSGIALQVILDLFPLPKPETWMQCEKYVAHAVQMGDWADLNEKQAEKALLFNRLSVFLDDRGRWRERELVSNKYFELERKTRGEQHPDTVTSMEHLASTYYNQGRYKEAEALNIQVLDLRREILGDKHPGTMLSMGNLALTYHKQGRYQEAELLKVQVLDLRREVLGDEHPDTIQSMGSLATTYCDQGRHKEAELLEVKALHLRRKILGDKHPDTIRSMAKLASTYHEQGRYSEVEPIRVQVLNLRREVLGDKHPDTIWSMVSLASIYYSQGRYSEAELLFTQALQLRQEVLGKEHPDTVSSMGSLALIYHRQGRFSEAQDIEVQVLKLRQEKFGGRHPQTILSMGNLAVNYSSQGLLDKAEAIEVQVLDLTREILGKDHRDTLSAMNNLAHTWKKQGRHHDALGLMRECVESRRSVLGPLHPHTVDSEKRLGEWKSEHEILESNSVNKKQSVVDSPSEREEESSGLGHSRFRKVARVFRRSR